MSKKNKNVLLSSKELKVKIKSLESDFKSISSMHSPNKDLIKSIREKRYHLIEQLKKAERWERRKHERQLAHKNDKKNTIIRKNEQEGKQKIKHDKEIRPNVSFGSTLSLSGPS